VKREGNSKTQVQTTNLGTLRVGLVWKCVTVFAFSWIGRIWDSSSGPRVPVPLARHSPRATGKNACPTPSCWA